MFIIIMFTRRFIYFCLLVIRREHQVTPTEYMKAAVYGGYCPQSSGLKTLVKHYCIHEAAAMKGVDIILIQRYIKSVGCEKDSVEEGLFFWLGNKLP